MPGLVPGFAEASPGGDRTRRSLWRSRVPGIHVFLCMADRDVDGRDEPGHDEKGELGSGLWAVIAFDNDDVGNRVRLADLDVVLIFR